jgi:hypothetical protein
MHSTTQSEPSYSCRYLCIYEIGYDVLCSYSSLSRKLEVSLLNLIVSIQDLIALVLVLRRNNLNCNSQSIDIALRISKGWGIASRFLAIPNASEVFLYY